MRFLQITDTDSTKSAITAAWQFSAKTRGTKTAQEIWLMFGHSEEACQSGDWTFLNKQRLLYRLACSPNRRCGARK
jgi:hypothetical protein